MLKTITKSSAIGDTIVQVLVIATVGYKNMSTISFIYEHFAMIFIPLTTMVMIVYASCAEWLLHREVMHKEVKIFGVLISDYACRAHRDTHHKVFGADGSYHLQVEEDKETIPMAWWNGPILIQVFSVPPALISWYLHTWSFISISLIVFTVYYLAYERLHWCMHLPRAQGFLKKIGLFHFVDNHHNVHHAQMGKNLNVVLPIADWFMDTLVLTRRDGRGVPPVRKEQPLVHSF